MMGGKWKHVKSLSFPKQRDQFVKINKWNRNRRCFDDEAAEVYADILYRKRIHFSMLLDRAAAAADDDDGVHNIIYYYNDSKTHSKMDINYRGFSFPPLYTATAGRISRTFWAFWCTSRICQTGRRWRVFQPSKKRTQPYAKYFIRI